MIKILVIEESLDIVHFKNRVNQIFQSVAIVTTVLEELVKPHIYQVWVRYVAC